MEPIDRHQPGISLISFLERFKKRSARSMVKSVANEVNLFSDKSRWSKCWSDRTCWSNLGRVRHGTKTVVRADYLWHWFEFIFRQVEPRYVTELEDVLLERANLRVESNLVKYGAIHFSNWIFWQIYFFQVQIRLHNCEWVHRKLDTGKSKSWQCWLTPFLWELLPNRN